MTTQPASAPLLIACALGIESFALRTSDRGAGRGAVDGMGRGIGAEGGGVVVCPMGGRAGRAGAVVLGEGILGGMG